MGEGEDDACLVELRGVRACEGDGGGEEGEEGGSGVGAGWGWMC